MVVCLERDADLHIAQRMPLPLTVSCFSRIQIGLPFWYRLTRVVMDKGPLNGCVCIYGHVCCEHGLLDGVAAHADDCRSRWRGLAPLAAVSATRRVHPRHRLQHSQRLQQLAHHAAVDDDRFVRFCTASERVRGFVWRTTAADALQALVRRS